MSTASKWADLGERSVWTLIQAGIGEEAVQLANLPQIYAVPIAFLAALIKGALAQKFGNGTAATLPKSVEPAPPAAPPAPVRDPQDGSAPDGTRIG